MSQLRQRRGGDAGSPSEGASNNNKQSSKELFPQPWAPSARDALHILLFVRIVGTVLYSLISDCDETFNYWEPTHMMLYGRGLQTWEYSPQYALRSYAYTGFHAVLAAFAGGMWGADKVTIFHGTRIFLAAISAASEAVFYRGILKRLGPTIARYAIAGLVCSAGLLHASPAYLPSTWTMYGLMLTWGYWMEGNNIAAVWAAVVGLACGWPFAVVALVPLVLHIAITACIDWTAVGTFNLLSILKPQAWRIAAHSLLSLALVLGLQAAVDHSFYHAWLIAPWNIIKYNALGHGGGGQGSNLYGVEPWTYYLKNIALNFNIIAVVVPISLLAVLLMAGRRAHGWDYAVCIVAQLFLWLAAMWPRPHKEERFLFPVYPLFPLAGAFSLYFIETVLTSAASAVGSRGSLPAIRRLLLASFAAVTGALSASRIGALIDGFGAPFYAWGFLSTHLSAGGPSRPYSLSSKGDWSTGVGARVCVGKEWYRFPASFYLPEATKTGSALAPNGYNHVDGGKAELSFLKSGFGGLLPQAYLPPVPSVVSATQVHRTGYNDLNQEEADRYVDVNTCDYVVDLELPVPREQQDGAVKGYEPYFDPSVYLGTGADACACPAGSTSGSTHTAWKSIYSRPFVHADSSPALTRAFYIPGYSHKRNSYGKYHVLQKVACTC